MNRVQVCAVKGKLVPHPTKRFEYVGYAVCPDARDADFVEGFLVAKGEGRTVAHDFAAWPQDM